MDTASLIGSIGAGGVVGSLLTMLVLKRSSKEDKHDIQEFEWYSILDTMQEGAGITDASGKWYFASRTLRKLFALGDKHVSQIENSQLPQIETKSNKERLDRFLLTAVQDENQWITFPKCKAYTHASREPISIRLQAKRIKNDAAQLDHFAIVISDLRVDESIEAMEHTHQLTGIPNEIQAKKDLNKILARIHLEEKGLAVLMIDLDHYSQIRAMLGPDQAEKQLMHAARYLQQAAERIGGKTYHMFTNVFMVILPKVDDQTQVINFNQNFQNYLSQLYEIDGIKLHLSASVGAALYPESGSTLTLVNNAFKALYEAQKEGFGKLRFSHQIQHIEKYDEMELYNSLHQAIENEEFEIYYQPIVLAANQEVVGAEALIRWKHPKYGFVPPDLFVPMLEKSGYIIELGRYVLVTVLKQIKRWEMFRFKPVQISINMSLIELESDGFIQNIQRQLQAHRVFPELIKFEITEGIAMQNESVLHERLLALKKIGIATALDDFGTGYTSFSYLKRIPAGMVKIDRSMVMHILDNKEDERIVQSMIDLAHNLDMKVVVEGVEDEWMTQKLVELGADYLQGYYFGRPLPAFEFQEMIRFEKRNLGAEHKFLK